MAAVHGGVSVDTSMGMTPLEGLVMGTRCGDLDPAVVLHLMDACGHSTDEVGRMLNEESGLLGLSCLSSDMREVLEAAESGHEGASLAVAVFCRRARKYVGAYAAVMGGLDAIVFTGGIGEHEPAVRSGICEGLSFLGVEVSEAANAGDDVRIESGEVAVLVIPTDEELALVRETARALQGDGAGAEAGSL
jgi:acetate kinase